jgi:hypothetical protein
MQRRTDGYLVGGHLAGPHVGKIERIGAIDAIDAQKRQGGFRLAFSLDET